jgi:hypothetical protein
MIAAAGAGPDPIPHQELTSETLAEAIRFCRQPGARAAAGGIAEKMRRESGVVRAVQSFHNQLPLEKLQCDILPDQPAVWRYRGHRRGLKLGRLACEILKDQLKISGDSFTL